MPFISFLRFPPSVLYQVVVVVPRLGNGYGECSKCVAVKITLTRVYLGMRWSFTMVPWYGCTRKV